LDLARAVAACYVVVHHVTVTRNWGHGIGSIFRFGQEAVIVFFLLSGFVIFANERERALNPTGYYLRRLRRIYPILIAAMAVSVVVAFDNGELLSRFSWASFAGTLLSLQDISALKPGVIVNPFLGNDPLWSLSYEVAFYIIFPIVLKAWVRFPIRTNTVVGFACCVLFGLYAAVPNHFALVGAYFLLWWTGAMVAKAYMDGGRDVRSVGGIYFWLLGLCALALVVVRLRGNHGIGLYPVLMLRHFAVAAIMVAVLFGPVGRAIASLSSVFAKAASVVASISFGLYVFHFPLLVNWHRSTNPIGFIVALIILVAVSYLAERELPKILLKAPRD
jgi:peptidoglycan/LPS O-acetylase OafA/YrhL